MRLLRILKNLTNALAVPKTGKRGGKEAKKNRQKKRKQGNKKKFQRYGGGKETRKIFRDLEEARRQKKS